MPARPAVKRLSIHLFALFGLFGLFPPSYGLTAFPPSPHTWEGNHRMYAANGTTPHQYLKPMDM